MRANLRSVAAVGLVMGCARGASVDELDGITDDAIRRLDDAGAAPVGNPGAYDGEGDAEGGEGMISGELPAPDAGRTANPDGTTPAPVCSAPVSCEQAKAVGIPHVGSIEWAKTDLIATQTEAGSRWYLVGVTGDSASEVVKGGIEARLTSPPGSNYDLFLYGGAQGYNSGLEPCEGPQASASNPGEPAEVATRVWAAAAFGALSDRLVTVEVRHIAGPCAEFTLELRGAKQ